MIIKVCQFRANQERGEHFAEVFHPGEMEKAASFFSMNKSASPMLPEVQAFLEKLKPDPQKIYVLVNALGAGEYWGCFPAGAPVQTKKGWVPIEGVGVGTEVLTHQNRWCPVTATQVRDHDDKLWDLEISGLPRYQPYISATPNHEIYVVLRDELVRSRRKHLHKRPKGVSRDEGRNAFLRELPFDWASISELRAGDCVLQPFPVEEATNPSRWSDTGIALLAGVYAAEGCIANRYDKDTLPDTDPCYKIIYTLGPTRQDIAEKIKAAAEQHNYHPTIREEENCIRVELCWSDLARFLRDNVGHHATEKYLSNEILTMSRKWQEEFFYWYAEGDGYVSKTGKGEGTVRCSSASLQLLYDLRLLLARLGKVGQITGRHNEASSFYNGNPIFELSVSGTQMRGEVRNVEAYIHPDGYILSPIRKVSARAFHGKVYNIEVEEDESYTIGGLAVHNSNINGDWFPEASLIHKGPIYGHETFYQAYPYKHHVNKDPSKSFGKVELSCWNEPMKRVELVVSIDRGLARRFGAEDVVDKLDNSQFPDVSMGCLPKGSPVFCADGDIVPIEDVKEGNEVITHKGRPRAVHTVMERPHEGSVYHVKAYGSRNALVLTEEHPLWVVRKEQTKCHPSSKAINRSRRQRLCVPGSADIKLGCAGCETEPRYRFEWVPAASVMEGDYLATPILNYPVRTKFTADQARLLGYYLAEGIVLRTKAGNPMAVQFCTGLQATDVHEELYQLGDRLGLNVTEYISEERSGKYISIWGRSLAELCTTHCGEKSLYKSLSSDILGADTETLLLFLGAYANGDGGCYKGSLYFSTASERLSEQLRMILAKCGMIASVNEIVHKASKLVHKETVEYQIWVGTDTAWKLTTSRHVYGKSKRPNSKRFFYDFEGVTYLMSPIESVEEVPYGDKVYNFGVEEDESYLVDGLAVHNCKVPYDLCSKCLDWEKYRKAQSTFDPQKHRSVGAAVLEYHKKDPIRGLSVTRNDYCEHLKTMLNKILDDGTKVYAINDYPRFFDISFVFIGADKTAKVMAKLAFARPRGNVLAVPSWMVAEEAGYRQPSVEKGFEKVAEDKRDLEKEDAALREVFQARRPSITPAGVATGIDKVRDKLREKSAAKLKDAEIIKQVRPSQFGGKVIPTSRPDIPDEVLDTLGKHSLSEALSTPTTMGMILKPREFQRITIIGMGKKPLADELDSRGLTFPPVEESDKSVPLGSSHFSDILKKLLLPLMEDRSLLEPVARRRIVRITICGKPEEEDDFRDAEETPFLQKISAAYNGYLDRIDDCLEDVESIVGDHPDFMAKVSGVGVSDLFEKTAAGEINPLVVIGAIGGAAGLSQWAKWQRHKAMMGARRPISPGMDLLAENPKALMTVAGLGALHQQGSDIPRRLVRGIAEAVRTGAKSAMK